ncbi:MAG: hypothetical protein KIT09_20540 [Bryobacteraceae bacterium]|nr:hypothetical protein [Bryobacteraceae bacterium]
MIRRSWRVALVACALAPCLGQQRAAEQTSLTATPEETRVESGAPEQRSEAAAEQRLELNLLGQTDAASGESRRNENVQFNLIDRNAMRELNARLGVTATPVERFDPERSYFGAEYGRPPSAPIHAQPSRDMALHGALWEAHSNHLFRARSYFQAGEVRPATENDYGFRLGGRLLGPARVSLDGSQQKLRGFVNGNVLVPLPGERTPLATDPFLRALVARWLAAYPAEAPNRTDIDPRALNTNAPQRINTDSAGSRVDAPLGSDDWLGMRYQFTSQQVDAFQLVAGQNPDTDTHSHTGVITWTRAVSPATVTYSSIGFERVTTRIRPEENAVGPTVSAANVIQGLGPPPPIPILRAQNRFRYAGAVEQTRGAHRWSAGAEALRSQVNGREQDGERGIITFGNDFGRDALTNFLLGTPSTYTQSLGNTHRGYRVWNFLLYAGDAWRVHPRLTLQAGIRFEPMTRPIEVNRLDEIPFPCDCNNVAPRLGQALRLPGDWGTLRASYGLHYGEIFATTYSQVRMSRPGSYRVIAGAPDLRDPLRGLTLADIGPGFRAGIFDVSRDMVTPYSHQYNLAWERELGGGVRIQAAYIGSRTHKLFQMRFDNRARIVPGIPQTTATINQRRPDPNLLEALRLLNGSRAYFDAARVTLTVPRAKGLGLDVSYWFSKSIDLGNDYTSTLSGVDARQGRSQSEDNVHGDLKGLSQFDQPHALLARGSYETPPLRAAPAWLRRLAGVWVVTGVLLLKNGTPFSVESGSDGPGFGNVDGQGSDRVNVVDPAVLGRTIGNPDASQRLLPRSAFSFIRPADDRGNLGRNTFRRGRIANVNAALERTWRLRREWALAFRAESINFFNTPQFAEPNYNLVSPSFGAITNTLNDGRAFRFRLEAQF